MHPSLLYGLCIYYLLVLLTILWGKYYYYFHFTDTEIKMQRSEGTCPRPHSYKWWSWNLNPGRLPPETVLISTTPSLFLFDPVAVFIFQGMFWSVDSYSSLMDGVDTWSHFLAHRNKAKSGVQWMKTQLTKSSPPFSGSSLGTGLHGLFWAVLKIVTDQELLSLLFARYLPDERVEGEESIQARNNSGGYAGKMSAKRKTQAVDLGVDGKGSWKEQWKGRWLRCLASV